MDPQTTPPATTPIVTPPVPKTPSKLLWIILVIVLMLGFGIGGVFLGKQMANINTTFTPTPTIKTGATENWQTYSNTQFGYSLRYPNNYSLTEIPQHPGWINIFDKNEPATIDTANSISVGIYNNDKKLSAMEYVESVFPPELLKNINIHPVSIDGNNGFRFQNEPGLPGYHEAIYLPIGTQIFVIRLGSIEKDSEFSKTFDQILSTFRFLPSGDDAKKKADIQGQLRPGLEMYRADNKYYPNNLDLLIPNYLVVMPKDFTTNEYYKYQIAPNKLDYSITATLDDGSPYIVNAPQN